jgi:hypothetical protein
MIGKVIDIAGRYPKYIWSDLQWIVEPYVVCTKLFVAHDLVVVVTIEVHHDNVTRRKSTGGEHPETPVCRLGEVQVLALLQLAQAMRKIAERRSDDLVARPREAVRRIHTGRGAGARSAARTEPDPGDASILWSVAGPPGAEKS